VGRLLIEKEQNGRQGEVTGHFTATTAGFHAPRGTLNVSICVATTSIDIAMITQLRPLLRKTINCSH
jgi:hypothetical protein